MLMIESFMVISLALFGDCSRPPVVECDPPQCNGRGDCIDMMPLDVRFCQCHFPYHGEHCEKDFCDVPHSSRESCSGDSNSTSYPGPGMLCFARFCCYEWETEIDEKKCYKANACDVPSASRQPCSRVSVNRDDFEDPYAAEGMCLRHDCCYDGSMCYEPKVVNDIETTTEGEIDIPDGKICTPDKCSYSGECIPGPETGNYFCKCHFPFHGENCEKNFCDIPPNSSREPCSQGESLSLGKFCDAAYCCYDEQEQKCYKSDACDVPSASRQPCSRVDVSGGDINDQAAEATCLRYDCCYDGHECYEPKAESTVGTTTEGSQIGPDVATTEGSQIVPGVADMSEMLALMTSLVERLEEVAMRLEQSSAVGGGGDMDGRAYGDINERRWSLHTV